MSKYFNLILLLVCFSFVACSDLVKKEEEQETKTYDQFLVCETDADAIAKILTLNIEPQLECLKSNLDLFITLAKGENKKAGYLSRKDLITFINMNMKEVTEENILALNGVFDLNSILLGDDPDYISRENVGKLTGLLIKLNKIFVESNLYEYFTTDVKVDLSEHRRRKYIIYKALTEISEIVTEVYVTNNRDTNGDFKPNSNQIELKSFITKFKNDDNAEILEHAKNLLFAKKAMLGGDTAILKSSEVVKLLKIVGDLGRVAYDFVNLPDTDTEAHEDEEILRSLKEGISVIAKNFHYAGVSAEPILSYNDIVYMADHFFPEFAQYIAYKESILNAKKVLFGSDSEYFSAGEVSFLLKDILYQNLNRGVYFYRAYRLNEDTLNSQRKITRDFTNVALLTEQDYDSSLDFNRIAKTYRFFKGSSFSPVFDKGYTRNARAFFEISVFEDLVQRFFVYYGSRKLNAVGKYIITLEQLEVFMEDFKHILVGENYIKPGREKNTAETITLMTSLFHSQSDGNDELSIPEFVEFAVTMLTSLGFADTMQEEMGKLCSLDHKGRYSPQCYRDNIHRLFDLEKSNKAIEEYIPQFKSYIMSLSSAERDLYLKSAAKFSRTCTVFSNGDEVPMDNGDGIVSWAGLLVVEQSMVRFDKNNSGVLEPHEVSQAYKIYKSAIEAMIPFDFLKRYSEDFFKYIVKYNKVPDVPEINGWRDLTRAIKEGVHFIKFLFKSDASKAANADRMTFAAVLNH